MVDLEPLQSCDIRLRGWRDLRTERNVDYLNKLSGRPSKNSEYYLQVSKNWTVVRWVDWIGVISSFAGQSVVILSANLAASGHLYHACRNRSTIWIDSTIADNVLGCDISNWLRREMRQKVWKNQIKISKAYAVVFRNSNTVQTSLRHAVDVQFLQNELC